MNVTWKWKTLFSFVLAVALAVGVCRQASAQQESDQQEFDQQEFNDAYQAGLLCFEQLDYRCAIEFLSVASYAQPTPERDRLIHIYRKLAESHLALGQRREALARFDQLLDLDESYRLLNHGVSPKVMDALEQARRSRSSTIEPKTQVASPSQEPAASARWLAGISSGVEVLMGHDQELFETGFGMDLLLLYCLKGPWCLATGLHYANHGLKADDGQLHWMGGWLGGGLEFSEGSLGLQILGGIGGSGYGIDSLSSEAALLIPLHLTLDWHLHSWLRLGLDLSPNWLLETGQLESSFTLGLAARLAAEF